MKHSAQSSQHSMPLLLHRGEIAADAAKGRGASRTAKGAGDLLLDFRHAQIPLGKVVRKGDGEVIEQSEHLLRPLKQGVQEVFGRTLFLPSLSLPYGGLCRRRLG